MDREKVAVIAPDALAAASGKHRPVKRVLERMLPHAAEQLHIRLFGVADGHLPSQGWMGGVPFYCLPGGRLYLESLLRHLRKWRPDTVDVHGRPLLACQLKARLPLSRVLLTLPSARIFSPPCHPKACTTQILESVDGLIVGSERTKAELLAQFPSLVTPVWVHLPGASLEEQAVLRWTPDGEQQRQQRLMELGWTNRKIVLLAGSWPPLRDEGHIVSALTEVLDRVPEAMLVFLAADSPGSGSSRELLERPKQHGLAAYAPERIACLPAGSPYSISDRYLLADCLVLLPGDEPASMLTRIEAMAAGLPTLDASDAPVLEFAVDGLLAEGAGDSLADRIVLLLEEEEFRQVIGRASREIVRRHYRWEHAADRWVSLVRARGIQTNAGRRSAKN
ncbi:glycosyltransferase, group 1 family protein [Paenibacillus sp. oral taxon 786 str. D14]|uniref:glycosyltransferase family 4 protein n=1 Tax=Paenibacillus sp. oral taxon 786 TaxID=652715 RepID=UPI0001AFDC34|nr:glycosyltransferase family 4 protein [Paenibacillus sp. oral taxon 786]EES72964.1 glycosyltransferase, group 1 family protein [Paenibacillus sp. oral taxon 786 str. D14]